ncbi:hypothetical protein BH11PAT2_BH11PAT2_04080 [soil metagenome]
MNTTTKLVLTAIIGVVVGAGGVMAFSDRGDRGMGGSNREQHMMADDTAMNGSANTDMQSDMASMMSGLQGKTSDAFDQAFLSEMIVHHQGAVQMAQAALKDAKHQEIKDLAQKIITAQDAEIAQMQAWQKTWYGN